FRYAIEPLDATRGKLVGLDFSADMLVQAQRRVDRAGWRNVELLQGDATTMNLGRTFDGILFAYSLTMIPDWPAALRRAWEHLRPGGRMVVLDFCTFDSWGPLAPVMRGWLRANHVETRRPYIEKMREIFPDLNVTTWMGGYNFTAVGLRRAQHAGA
ncbi:MAG: class I SAM-dependent methyltransferase, partial [Phycisphaerae bacterium]